MRRKSRVVLSESDLAAYSREHLAYEIQMFFATAQILSRLSPPANPPDREIVVNNVYIESFVIHLRNLIEFFYPQRIKNSVIAEYFFVNPTDWKHIRPKIPKTLKDARERSHRELAHLTTDRLSVPPSAKRWPVISLAKQIKDLVEQFVNSASSVRLDPSVRTLVGSIDLTGSPLTVTDPSTRSV